MSAGEHFPTSSSYTKMAWVYRTGSGSQGGNNILSGDDSGGGHVFWAPDMYSNQLSAGQNSNWDIVQDSQALGLNTWYHVAVSYDAESYQMVLYKNGNVVNSAQVDPADRNVTDPTVSIGSFGYSNGYMWQGTIDDVRIYNRALSEAQIAALHNGDTNLLKSDETESGDVWQCRVTPFSDTAMGSNYASNSLTIQDQPATLTLSKVVVNDDGGAALVGDFQAYIDSDPVAWGVAQSLDAGSYTASEGGLAGYTASDWGGDCAADGSITLQPGESKACSISNDDQPATLTLSKLVANDDGGTAVAGDFQAYIDSDPVAWGVAQSLDAGSYTASEDGLAGYTASDWGGDCAADGSIILQPGDVKSCSISNDDQPATLTLTKVVVNDDGGTAAAGDFQAYIDSDPVAWGVAQSLDAGS